MPSPNEIVALHRQDFPADPRTDDELTLAYADGVDMGRAAQAYPQFAADHARLMAQRAEALKPGLGGEFARGVSRGTSSLESAGYGAAALAASTVGADRVRDWALAQARAKEEDAASQSAGVPDITEAQSVGDYAHYVAGKAGELVPNVVEAGVTGLIGGALGGAAGTAVEPGGGTAVGAGSGFLYGLLERQAVKTLVRKAAEEGIEDTASVLTQKAVANTAKSLAAKYGATLAETVNFWAQSSGSTYNELVRNPNVDPNTAINTAIFGGLAQAVPAQFLPSYVLGKFFGPENAAVTGPYFLRLVKEAGKVVPGGAAAMSMQELASIASDKFADPATREQAFDFSKWGKQDQARLVNASVTGGMAGLLGAAVSAIHKGEAPALVADDAGSDLGTVAARMKENPSPLVEHPELHGPPLPASAPADLAAPVPAAPAVKPPDQVGEATGMIPVAVPETPSAPEVAGVTKKTNRQRGERSVKSLDINVAPEGDEPVLQEAKFKVGDRVQMPERLGSSSPVAVVEEVDANGNIVRATTDWYDGNRSRQSRLVYDRQDGRLAKGRYEERYVSGAETIQPHTEAQTESLPPSPNNPTPEQLAAARAAALGFTPGQRGPAPPPVPVEGSMVRGRRPVPGDLENIPQPPAEAGHEPAPLPGNETKSGVEQPADTVRADVAQAAAKTDTNPTTAQKEAGNYAKGEVTIPGLPPIKIENPAGSVRSGKGTDGKPWEVTMPNHYGYFKHTEGHDGDAVDVHIGPHPEGDKPVVEKASIPDNTLADESGKPIVALHGTDNMDFNPEDIQYSDWGHSGPGIYFTTNEKVANTYSKAHGSAKQGRILKAYIESKKPYGSGVFSKEEADVMNKALVDNGYTPIKNLEGKTHQWLFDRNEEQASDTWDSVMKQAGYDSVKIKGADDDELVVYDPKQIHWIKDKPVVDQTVKKTDGPEHDKVWVVDQVNPQTGKFDEVKTFVGFADRSAVERAYDAGFSDGSGPLRRAEITETTKAGLKEWMDSPKSKESFAKLRPVDAVTLADVDLKNGQLDFRETERGVNRGKAGAGNVTKDNPGYFDVLPEHTQDMGELARHLTANATARGKRPDGKKSGTQRDTHRMTALRDNQTGEVHLLGTWKDKDQKPKIENEAGGDSRFLYQVLQQEMGNGQKRYTPIASLLLHQWRNGYHETFKSEADFREKLGEPARAAVKAKAAEAFAYEEAQRKLTGANKKERDDSETGEEPSAEHGVEPEAPAGVEHVADESGGGVLTHEHIEALQDVFAGDKKLPSKKDFIDDFMDRITADDDSSRTAKAGVMEAVRDEMVSGSSPQKALATVQEKIYEALKDGYAGGAGAFERSARDRFIGKATDGAGDKVEAPQAPAGQQRAERQTEGGGGAEDADSADLKHRAPAPTPQQARESHVALLGDLHKAMVQGGLNVRAVAQDLTGMAGAFAKRTGAAYDHATRTVTQVLGSVIGKEDVITAFHEIGHDVFANLPPLIRGAVTRAIEGVSDKALGLDLSADPRIRADNPAGLSNLHEERLVEATAQRLTQAGFNPTQSQGWAQQWVRAAKDLYYQAAMSVQRALLGPDYTNPAMAQRFFENRVRQFLSGDRSLRENFMDLIGGAKPNQPAVGKWLAPRGQELFERMNQDGTLGYDHTPDDDLASARFNDLKFRRPDQDPTKNQVEAEQRIALANHTGEMLRKAAESPEVKAIALKRGLDARTLLLKDLGLTDPVEIARPALEARNADRTPVDPNSRQQIGDFKSPSVLAKVANSAYTNAHSLLHRLAAVVQRDTVALDQVTKEREARIERMKQAQTTYEDWQGSTSWAVKAIRNDARDLFRSITGTSKRQGVFEQQLRQLDPTANLRRYLPEFQRLFTGRQLDGENLFTLLDRVANDPRIDFKQDASEIRDAMREDTTGDYAKLIGNDRESVALLSAVVGYAKLHQREMANLELRRMTNAPERVAIAKRMEELRKDKSDFLKSIGELPRSAATEERLRLAYKKEAREVAILTRRQERLNQRIALADAMRKPVAAEHARLADAQTIATGVVFRADMPYVVPETPTATVEELKAAHEGKESPWTRKRIGMDARKPTELSTPDGLRSDVTKMRAWMMERDRMAANGDTAAHDSVYLGIKRAADEIDQNLTFRVNHGASDRVGVELGMMAGGIQLAEGTGLPAAQNLALQVRKFAGMGETLREENNRIAEKTKHYEDELLKLFPDKTPDARNTLRKSFLNPAYAMFEQTPELSERYAGDPVAHKAAVLNRVMALLVDPNSATAAVVKGKEAAFRAGIERILDHHYEAGQRWLKLLAEGRIGVTDEKLQVYDPHTGKMVDAVRPHMPKGLMTFQRTIDHEGFRKMVAGLRGSGWGGNGDESLALHDFGTVADLYNAGPDGPAKVDALIAKYFQHPEGGQQVRDQFLGKLAGMENQPAFDAPRMADGVTRPKADVGLIQEAYAQSHGDPRKFLEMMYDLHGGQDFPAEEGKPAQNKGTYVQAGLERMAAYATRADNMMRQMEGNGASKEVSLRGMFANALIDSRTIDDLPTDWFRYHTFDQRDVYKTAERVRAEIAFGRNGERAQAAADAVQRDIRAAQDRVGIATDLARSENPKANARQIRAIVLGKLGRDVVKTADNARLLDRSVTDLSTYFRKDSSPDATLSWVSRMGNLLGSLMVQQPSSAIAAMASCLDVSLRYGFSATTLNTTARVVKEAGREIAGSLAQAVGLQMFNSGSQAERFQRLGFQDAGAIQRFSDSFARLDGEGTPAYFARAASGLLSTGINALGDRAQHTVFRPLNPFTTAYMATNKAITFGVWHMAERYLDQAVQHLQAHPDLLNDPGFKLTPETMGMKRFEKDSFARFQADMLKWGMDFDQMARQALARGDGPLLTDEHAKLLYGMALSEVSLESSLATRPTAGFNNPWLKAALPLLGWSLARTRQIADLRLNPEGRNELKSFLHAMAGLAVVTGGGLAMSALIDQYYEQLLGKQRNIRPVLGAQDGSQLALAVLENTNRVGTWGMFGELANSLLGEGGGGDNRMLSVDQRVVAISSLQSIMQAGSAFFNQGFNADYAHVVRPLLGATGMGAYIQYMQLANHAFGLDNAEARVTARINAQNYLRVVGRELNLDVRLPDGGASNPTPVTPFLTHMELAAYKNNPGDFQDAYRSAVTAAKANGQADPVEYVKRAYSSRNPLRNTFRTAVSEAEYHRLLANMPGSGSQDVREAVNLFNHYAEKIGAKPFDGKTDKPPGATKPVDLAVARAAAFR